MCGIGGRIAFDDRADSDLGEAMAACMSHRGPDASGVYANGPATLAHRRLSIFDLSDAGRQPMVNGDGTVHVVFNGEIYNYPELRSELDRYTFRSETDTEVLLYLYEEHGVDCLGYLRGMFAFGIWDETEERLFIARDRLGQKPLFFRRDGESLWFGSTVKAILADDRVDPRPDERAIEEFLVHHYVPAPRTGFKQIEQLRPAEYAIFDEDGLRRDSYWSASFAEQSSASPKWLAEQLRSELRQATRLRLRSDVPVGVFLSGGIDSSVVTALASDISDEPIDTYTVGFDREESDEREFGRLVAEEFGTNHHESRVSLNVKELLPVIIDHYEMPFGDPSAVPTYYVSQVAARDKKVVVGGDGGDELFAGYSRYTRDWLLEQLARVPNSVLSGARGALGSIFEEDPGSRVYYARRLMEVATGDEIERHGELVCHATNDRLDGVLSTPVSDSQFDYLRSVFETVGGPSLIDRMTHVDMQTYFPNAILTKVDRATMAHALEARSPFLDHKFAEFAARIPSKYKWRYGSKKWILRRAFAEELPELIRTREKDGFGAPIGKWIREDLNDVVCEKLDRLGDRPQFHAAGIDRQLRQHLSGEKSHVNRVWNQLMLELWFERFIDGDTDLGL